MKKSPLTFGSVVEFQFNKYIFLHTLENKTICYTMDYRIVSFNASRFHQLSRFYYQFPVKFHEGFSYCITNNKKIIHEFPGIEAFSPEITKELLKKASEIPWYII